MRSSWLSLTLIVLLADVATADASRWNIALAGGVPFPSDAAFPYRLFFISPSAEIRISCESPTAAQPLIAFDWEPMRGLQQSEVFSLPGDVVERFTLAAGCRVTTPQHGLSFDVAPALFGFRWHSEFEDWSSRGSANWFRVTPGFSAAILAHVTPEHHFRFEPGIRWLLSSRLVLPAKGPFRETPIGGYQEARATLGVGYVP